MKWKLFLIAQPQIANEGQPDEYTYYQVGTQEITKSQTVLFGSDSGYDLFCYVTQNESVANYAYSQSEFIGVNSPLDIVARYTLGLSNAATVAQMKRITGARWWVPYVDEENPAHWEFGNILDWEAGGSLEPVWFGSYRKILGVEYD